MSRDRNLRLPLRWEFASEDGSGARIFWRWRMYDHGGRLVRAGAQAFETLSECIDDARKHGYIEPAGA